jgi:hypothetical protein
MDFDSLQDDSEVQAAPTPTPTPPPNQLNFDDLQEDPKFDDLQDDSEKAQTPGQQALTVVEGLGRGASFGLSDALARGMRSAATEMGVPQEYLHYVAPETKAIAERKEANPFEAGASELAGNLVTLKNLPQIGSKTVNAMLQMGAMGAGDEFSKSMLGQGNPVSTVAWHVAGDAAAGLVGGKLFAPIEEKGLKYLENAKLGTTLNSFLAGVGHAATLPGEEVVSLENSALLPEERAKLSDTAFKAGQTVYKNIGAGLASAVGLKAHGAYGFLAGGAVEKYIEKVIAPYTSKVSQKYVAPAILKAASSGTVENLTKVLDHAQTCQKGYNAIMKGVKNLFEATGNKAVDIYTDDRDREALSDYISDGGADKEAQDYSVQTQPPPQSFAEGGAVGIPEENPIAKLYPEEHILLAAAKGHVSKFLSSVRPLPSVNKLPYDNHHDHPVKQREYNQYLDLANQPLSILNDIKDGSLSPPKLSAFKSMFPQLHQELAHRINKEIVERQVNEEKKPPYKQRQTMSMFLGKNLESTLTPQAIMAAQSTFMPKQVPQGSPMPTKNSKAGLSKLASNALTPDQARQQRSNKD